MTSAAIYLTIRSLARTAGLGHDVTPHSFRRSCASRLLAEDISENSVRQLLGWARNSAMLSRYVKATEAEQARPLQDDSVLRVSIEQGPCLAAGDLATSPETIVIMRFSSLGWFLPETPAGVTARALSIDCLRFLQKNDSSLEPAHIAATKLLLCNALAPSGQTGALDSGGTGA